MDHEAGLGGMLTKAQHWVCGGGGGGGPTGMNLR
jgi:hypothetical protein